jgi:hypothetical protein
MSESNDWNKEIEIKLNKNIEDCLHRMIDKLDRYDELVKLRKEEEERRIIRTRELRLKAQKFLFDYKYVIIPSSLAVCMILTKKCFF